MLSPKVKAFLEKYLDSILISNYKIENAHSNPKGSGFMGKIIYLTIVNKDSNAKHNLVIKCAYDNVNLRKNFPIRTLFVNEVNFYFLVLPELKAIKKFDFISSPLFRTTDTDQEALIMQNFKEEGFSCFPENMLFDKSHLNLLMKTYARFHACSFALKCKDELKFSSYKMDKFRDNKSPIRALNENSNYFSTFFDCLKELCRLGSTYLDKDNEKEAMERYKKYTKILNSILDWCCTAEIERNCIIHGDCSISNFLFKYKIINCQRQPCDVRLIDFKCAKLASPVCDLSYCLYAGAPKLELDSYKDYLQLYYTTLAETLKDLGYVANELYPFEQLELDWKQYACYGMMMSLIETRRRLIPKEHIPDLPGHLERAIPSPFLPPGFDEDKFKKRVRDVLLHGYETQKILCL